MMRKFVKPSPIVLDYIATKMTKKEVGYYIFKFSRIREHAAFKKHFGKGKILKRRDTETERNYGMIKSVLACLTDIKNTQKFDEEYIDMEYSTGVKMAGAVFIKFIRDFDIKRGE